MTERQVYSRKDIRPDVVKCRNKYAKTRLVESARDKLGRCCVVLLHPLFRLHDQRLLARGSLLFRASCLHDNLAQISFSSWSVIQVHAIDPKPWSMGMDGWFSDTAQREKSGRGFA